MITHYNSRYLSAIVLKLAILSVITGSFYFIIQPYTASALQTEPCTLGSNTLSPNKKNLIPDVRALQECLAQNPAIYNGPITGFYGTLTTEAVKRFQTDKNIVNTGFPDTTGFGAVGPRTLEMLRSGQSSKTTALPEPIQKMLALQDSSAAQRTQFNGSLRIDEKTLLPAEFVFDGESFSTLTGEEELRVNIEVRSEDREWKEILGTKNGVGKFTVAIRLLQNTDLYLMLDTASSQINLLIPYIFKQWVYFDLNNLEEDSEISSVLSKEFSAEDIVKAYNKNPGILFTEGDTTPESYVYNFTGDGSMLELFSQELFGDLQDASEEDNVAYKEATIKGSLSIDKKTFRTTRTDVFVKTIDSDDTEITFIANWESFPQGTNIKVKKPSNTISAEAWLEDVFDAIGLSFFDEE